MCLLSSYYNKFIQSFIYSEKFRNEVYLGKYNSYICTQEFILFLENYVDEIKEDNNLNKNKIQKLQHLICFISFANKSLKRLIDKSNLIILRNLNYKLSQIKCSQVEDKSLFLSQEIIKRINIDKYDFDDIYKYRDYCCDVLKSFEYDFKILEYCVIEKDENIFENYVLNFINNKYFLYSLNGLIKDMPCLLDNEIFKLRIMYVFEVNEISNDEEIKELQRMYKIFKNNHKVKIK